MSTVIVSAYYKIPSKQPHSFYVPHLRRWLSNIRAPVIFFTSGDILAEIESWGLNLTNVCFIELPLSELNAWSLTKEFWNRQKERDPERYHTPELGAIWFEKKEFVLRAMNIRKDYSVFIWCDAGCIRNEASALAATKFGSRHTITANDTKLYIQYSFSPSTHKYYRFPYKCVAGAILAGSRIAWERHSTIYNSVLMEYDAVGVPAIMDQYIIKSCIDAFPDAYSLERPPPATDPWFFFLWTL